MDTALMTPAIRTPSTIVPPFTLDSAALKVRAAEDAWNSRDPNRVALAYTQDSAWRNRGEFITGRDQIRAFLAGKWAQELDYRLAKALWAFTNDRIAVRFRYEWRNEAGNWFCSYGNELWEFDEAGLMRRREARINDLPIREQDRRFFWPAPARGPSRHPGSPITPRMATEPGPSAPRFNPVSRDETFALVGRRSAFGLERNFLPIGTSLIEAN